MLVLLAFAAFFAVPLIWLVLATTKTGYQLVSENPLAVGSFHNVAVAWRALDGFNDHIYRRWFANSIYYALSGTAVAIATWSACRLRAGRRHVPRTQARAGAHAGHDARAGGRASVADLPGAGPCRPPRPDSAAVIPPFAFFPFGVYISYLYYSTAVPPSLLDAARLDGCNEWQVFRRVALPLAGPVIGLVFFVSFTADWSSFFLPFVALTNPRQYTIQVGLTDVLTTASQPEIALATLIAAVPLAIVFVLCQRTLRYGLFGGMLKE